MARPPANVRQHPRLSATQLADYLAANTTLAQMGILRSAKQPADARPVIIQYQHARRAIAACLIDRPNLHRTAARAIADLEQRRDDQANRPLVQDDARRSIDVIETFQRSINQIDLRNVQFIAVNGRLPPLNINGVEVSVFPDALTVAPYRGGQRIGQLFVRCTIGQNNEAAENRRVESNAHLATLAHMHTLQHHAERGEPHGPTSLVLDVSRQRVIRGSANTARRIQNIEAACQMIAAVWPIV